MGKAYEELTTDLIDWISQQHLFFVSTAPLVAGGLLNCSPKGMDTFRVLGPREVAYLDLTGSGVETIAHLRENGRIVLLFCAFDGSPKIVRLHGVGEAITPGTQEYELLRGHFPKIAGGRAIIRTRLARVSTSCGYAVPRYDYVGDRDTLVRWAETKGEAELAEYRRKKNAQSLDGLPGLEVEDGEVSV